MKKIIFGILAVFVFIFGLCTINKSFAYPVTGPHWNKSPINVYIPNDAKSCIYETCIPKMAEFQLRKIEI